MTGVPDKGTVAGAPALISVIVPHYSDLAGLDRCLDALSRQVLDASFEIIVADNGSPEGEPAVTATVAGRARLVTNAIRGAGPTRNAGVAAARGDLLAFTDSDCVPHQGWLAAGLAALRDHDFAGGRMVVLVDESRHKSGAEAFEQVFAFDNARYVREKGFTVTANLFCSRRVFDAVGGFGVGMSEDLDWCRRARGLGYRLGYAADAVVGHPARADWAALRHKWRRINAESYALVSATLTGRIGWLARSWALPLSIVAHAPRIWRSPALASGRERRAALATLARQRLWRLVDAHRLVVRPR